MSVLYHGEICVSLFHVTINVKGSNNVQDEDHKLNINAKSVSLCVTSVTFMTTWAFDNQIITSCPR